MSSQVKFYKGMSNANAAEGLKKGGEASADDGGILFSSGETNESKRIYTKDSDLVIEYYKEDLEFTANKKLAASFGLKNAGDTVSAGTRVMDLLKLVLFVTYAPKYTPPSAKSKNVSVTVSKTSNDGDYIELGGTYKVSNLSITIEKNSVAKAESKLGTTTYSATGGDISSVAFTYKTGQVINDVEQVATITKDSTPYSITLTDDTNTGGLLNSWNTTTVDTLGEVNTDNILTKVSVTFSEGTSTNGSNKVKDSDGELTNKYSTTNYTTKLEDATTNSNIINDNLILERNIDWTISGLSKTLYGYLPIFTSKAIIAKVNGATDSLNTAKGWSANANYADSSDIFAEINVADATTYNKNIVGVSDLYLNETSGSRYYSFKFAQIKRSENQVPKFQFLMPSNLSLSGDFYVKGTDGKLSAQAGDIHITKDSTSGGSTYYRNRNNGSFTQTSGTNLDTYYLWEILYDLNIQSKGSQDVLVRIIKTGE